MSRGEISSDATRTGLCRSQLKIEREIMPILDIEIVMRDGETLPPGFAKLMAKRAGDVLHSAPGNTWVKVRQISPDCYAENDNGASDSPAPVFVSILKGKMPPVDELEREIIALTNATAELCHRPADNVHFIYLPEGKGRIAFGGKLLKR